MIEFRKNENILESTAQVLVNPVNTVGVCGKGLALQFKIGYPANYVFYKSWCENNKIVVGKIHYTEYPNFFSHSTLSRFIVNFPTKKHWKNPSQIEWIMDGLWDLKKFLINKDIQSISMPALGCGLGGLDWEKVGVCIMAILGDVDCKINVYLPQ